MSSSAFLLLQMSSCKDEKRQLNYTKGDLDNAIEKVSTGHLSRHEAFKLYTLPKYMISDAIHKKSAKSVPNKPGLDCLLSPEIKQCIYKQLLKMVRISYSQTKTELFDRVQMIVQLLTVPTPFLNYQLGRNGCIYF